MSHFELCIPIKCQIIKWSLFIGASLKKNDTIGYIKDSNNNILPILSPVEGTCNQIFIKIGDIINARSKLAVIVTNNINNNNNNFKRLVCFVNILNKSNNDKIENSGIFTYVYFFFH